MAKKKKRQATESRFQKRKAAKKSTLTNTIMSYRIWTVPVWGWLIIFGILTPILCILYVVLVYEYQDPPVIETFTAEVDNVWTEQRETMRGGIPRYYAKLMRESDELTCQIPSKFVPNIMANRSYEFETSSSRTKCVITAAKELTLFDLGNK